MHRISPHRYPALQRLGLALLAAGLFACNDAGPPDSGAEEAPAGGGFVILADEDDQTIGPNPEQGGMPFRPYFHDFGNVKNGDVVRHVFRLLNSGDEPITIKKIVPGCGCTIPRVRYIDADGNVVKGKPVVKGIEDYLVVPPQLLAELEIEVDTSHVSTKNADKTMTIVVTTDSPVTHYLTLEVHIVVDQRFYQVPKTGIHFGRVAENGGKQGATDVVRAIGFEDVITGIESTPEGVTAEIFHDQWSHVWNLKAELHPPLDIGPWRGDIVLKTETANGDSADPVVLGLRADIVPDILASPSRIVFAARATGAVGEVTLETLLAGHRLRMTDAVLADEAHNEWLAVEFEAIGPDSRDSSASWILRLRAKSQVESILRGDIHVRFDDTQHPKAVVAYVVHP